MRYFKAILFMITVPILGAMPVLTQDSETFIGAIPAEIVSMDPHLAGTTSDDTVTPLIWEGLVSVGPDGEWTGVLAESWIVSNDGLVWTFYLRQNVLFHNRRRMTSADVVFSFDRILSEDSTANMRSIYSSKIRSYSAVNEYTFQIELSGGAGTFLSELGLNVRTAIVPPESINVDGTITQPIGTGPFEFVGWEPGIQWTAKRFDHYWGKVANFSAVRFVPILDANVRLIALQTGEVDWITLVPFDRVQELLSDTTDNIEVSLIYRNSTLRLNFNATREPLSNRLVRQAIAFALDKSQINEAIYFGLGEVQNQPFSPVSSLYLSVEDLYLNSNVETAQLLLDQAGYPHGLTLHVIHPQGFMNEIWDVIQSQLDPINITLDVEFVDVPQWVDRALSYDYDMTLNEQSSVLHWDRPFGYFDATSSSNWLVGGYNNDEVSDLLVAGRNEQDLAKARVIYARIFEILQDDAAVIYILASPDIHAWKSNLKDFQPSPATTALVWPGNGLNHAFRGN